MTLSSKAEVHGLFKMAEGMVRKQLEKQMDVNGAALKKLLESV